jgi:hypothetical protein
MKKIILTTITSLLMLSIMGCNSQSTSEKTTESDSNLEQNSQANLQNYDETAKGIPVKTQYPDTLEVSSMGSGEGVGVFFKFKPQSNALDESEVHFFLPKGAKTATEVKTYVKGSNGLMVNNGWTLVEDSNPPQELMYPWVKEIITFATDQEMMGHILLGETNEQGLRVTLLYPPEMADAYWLSVRPVLDNVVFDANLLPLKSSAEKSATEQDSERSVYRQIPLPQEAKLVGVNPKQIAINVFGVSEPGEGNFQEEVLLIDQSSDGALVTLTQTGLADDSVEGMRYRLEFLREADLWRLDWAGIQVRCYPNRGSQVWGTESCS